MMEYVAAAILLIVFAAVFWTLIKKAAAKALVVLVNSISGLLILVFLNTYMYWSIPINLPTIIVCGLFGIPGVGALIILHSFGMI